MHFFAKVRASIYGPDYYGELKGKPLSYSLKYFFALIAWLALIAAAVLLFRMVPAVNGFLVNAGAGVVNGYPDNLVITVASGSVSTNVPEPYFMPLPPALAAAAAKAYSVAASPPVNLLVIDTKDPLTISEFQNDRTLLLLSSDSVAYAKDQEGQSVVIQPLGSDLSLAVDKADVASFWGKAASYLKFLDGAIIVLTPVVAFLALALRLVYLFLLALLIWAIARISKMDVGYGQAYRWGIHLMTLPLLLTLALWLILPSAGIPFLFTLLALVMAAINLKGAPAVDSPVPPPGN